MERFVRFDRLSDTKNKISEKEKLSLNNNTNKTNNKHIISNIEKHSLNLIFSDINNLNILQQQRNSKNITYLINVNKT